MRTMKALTGDARSRMSSRRNDQAGAALVETSICMLLLAIFALGIAEYGSLFGNAIDVSGAVRSAARTGAATTTEPVSDDQIIRAAVSQRGGGERTLNRIVVYKATSANAKPDPACLATPIASLAGKNCNVWLPADFNKSEAALMASSGYAWPWTVTARRPGTDMVGVYVEVNRTPLERLVWSPTSYNDHMAMMVEPVQVASPPGSADEFNNGTTTPLTWNPSMWCTRPTDPEYTGNSSIDCNSPTGGNENGGGGGGGT
jgi:Flp pilus assembly protein TadG